MSIRRRYTPGSMPLRERKGGASEPSCVANGGLARMAARNVQIEQRTPEKLVANSAADDPGLLVAEYLSDSRRTPFKMSGHVAMRRWTP